MTDKNREALAQAQKLVQRARRRLIVGAAGDGFFTGVLFGCVPALLLGLSWLVGFGPEPGPWLMLFPGIGALFGVVVAIGLAPDEAHSALILDKAAGTGEALVSALTATDAQPAFRALAAEGGVSAVGDQPMRTLLPWRAPWTATAAVLALLATSALAFLPGAAEEPQPIPHTTPADVTPGIPSDTGSAGTPGDSTEGALPTDVVPTAETDPATLPPEDLETLARELAARGSKEAEAALKALEHDDFETARAALREALAAGSGVKSEDGTGSLTASSAPGSGVAGAWSSGRWPLRYDRAIRRYMAAQEVHATVPADGERNPR